MDGVLVHEEDPIPGAPTSSARCRSRIISGLEAGIRTVLVTPRSTRPDQVATFPYRPTRGVDSIADPVDLVRESGSEM